MILSETCHDFIGKFPEKKIVDMFVDAGFDAIDFTFSKEEYYNSDTESLSFKEKFTELKKYAEDKGIFFNQAHAPYPTSTNDKKRNEEIFHDVTRSMKNASLLGVRNIIVHPNQHLKYREESSPEILFEENMKFYNRLKPYCEEYEVCACIENMWQSKRTTYGNIHIMDSTCSTPEEFIRYIDELNSPCFKACLDVGHALLVHQDPSEFIKKLDKRLVALHVHDVDGHSDLHTFPYDGGLASWDTIGKALFETGYKGDFTLEVDSCLEKLPLELYPYMLKMIEASGRFVMNKIK